MSWTARDGTKLSYTLDLDPIFKDRVILHKEDPNRIYRPKPTMTGSPTIAIEISDRTVSVYMDVTLQLLPVDPSSQRLEIGINYTRAFSIAL